MFNVDYGGSAEILLQYYHRCFIALLNYGYINIQKIIWLFSFPYSVRIRKRNNLEDLLEL